MNHLIVPILSLCVGVGVVLADTPMPSQDQTVVITIKHREDEMGDAMIRRDIDRLSQIYAGDFATITSCGKEPALAAAGGRPPPRVKGRRLL